MEMLHLKQRAFNLKNDLKFSIKICIFISVYSDNWVLVRSHMVTWCRRCWNKKALILCEKIFWCFWRVTMQMQKLKFCGRHANGNLLMVKMNKSLALSEKQCSTWPSSQTDEGQVLKRVSVSVATTIKKTGTVPRERRRFSRFLRFCHFHTPRVLIKVFFSPQFEEVQTT